MIDTDKMIESVEKLERVFGGETRATQTIGEVAEILKRLRQAEKDAARYRWLRDVGCFERSADDFFWGYTAQPDLAIDEAIQCSK